MSTDDPLKELRAEIDTCDRAIVEWASRRIAIARQLAHVKNARGLPLRDLNREAAVRDFYRAHDLEDLARALIAAALRAEEEDEG